MLLIYVSKTRHDSHPHSITQPRAIFSRPQMQRMATHTGRELPYPLSEVMGPDAKLPSINMYSPTNSSAVNKKQHKNLARSLVSYKGPDIIVMILSITVLSISNIPTYYTQHRAYSRERAKLIKKMENYTILTALMNSFNARYPGYCVIAINDHNHYLKFQVVKDDPPDSIGVVSPSTPDTARVDSASASSSSTSATAASTYPPLQLIETNWHKPQSCSRATIINSPNANSRQ